MNKCETDTKPAAATLFAAHFNTMKIMRLSGHKGG